MTRAESKKIAELEAEIKRMRPVYRAAMRWYRTDDDGTLAGLQRYTNDVSKLGDACARAEKARKK